MKKSLTLTLKNNTSENHKTFEIKNIVPGESSFGPVTFDVLTSSNEADKLLFLVSVGALKACRVCANNCVVITGYTKDILYLTNVTEE